MCVYVYAKWLSVIQFHVTLRILKTTEIIRKHYSHTQSSRMTVRPNEYIQLCASLSLRVITIGNTILILFVCVYSDLIVSACDK